MTLRWLADLAGDREIWGMDTRAPAVVWVQQHLSPPFRAAARTSHPHLPFEDRSFDLIYSMTPLGPPADLADAWLLELKRVLRTGGRLYLAVLDKTAVTRLFEPASQPAGGPAALLRAGLSSEENRCLIDSDFASLVLNTPEGVHVVYDTAYLARKWERQMRLISVQPGGCEPFTGMLFERA